MADGLPIGVEIGAIGVDVGWWVDSARRLDEAGFSGVWSWDHFMSRGRLEDSVLECWTTLALASAATRRLTIGTLVANVMNRHPAVLARMASTLQGASGGRLVLGIGIGGHPVEHRAYGMPFPEPAERAARLEEAVAVIRALWSGGPVTVTGRFYSLVDAMAFPVPTPVPAIVVAGETPGGARLAARIGDGWTTPPEHLEALLPVYESALSAAGRPRASTRIVVAWEGGRAGQDAMPAEDPWIREPRAELSRWRARGADEVVIMARTTADVDRLVESVARW